MIIRCGTLNIWKLVAQYGAAVAVYL